MDYKEAYVAFLDILGFKSLINTERFDCILDVFKQITSSKDVMTNNDNNDDGSKDVLKDKEYNAALNTIQIYIMSDSIVVSSETGKNYSLDALIDTVIIIQKKLYALDKPVLLRGAIAKGEYYCGNGVAFGKGMVNAYLYQENYSKYPRVIVSKNLAQELTNQAYISKNDGGNIGKNQEKLILDEDEYYHIDALKEFLGGKKHEDPDCRKIKMMIDEYLNGYYDAGIREKYMWLNDDYIRVVENVVKTDAYIGYL